MGMEISAGGSPRSNVAPAPSANPLGVVTAAAASPAGTGPKDEVILSPQARALALSQEIQAATSTVENCLGTTEAEKAATDKFIETAKAFFAKAMGIDETKIGSVSFNDVALRHIIRNTVLGAFVPPHMRKWADSGASSGASNGGDQIAVISLHPNDPTNTGKTVARIVFDSKAMEDLARSPMKSKDENGDNMFTALDLMPKMKPLKRGEGIANDARFDEMDSFCANVDEGVPKGMSGSSTNRILLSDDNNRPYFLARFSNEVGDAGKAAGNVCFSLLQLAGSAP